MVVRYNQRKNCECDMATPQRIYADLFPHRNTTMLSPIPLNVTYGPYLSCNDVRHAPDTRGDHEMICTLEANPSKKADHVKWSLESGEDIESNENFMINTTEEPLKVIIALELGIQRPHYQRLKKHAPEIVFFTETDHLQNHYKTRLHRKREKTRLDFRVS